MSSRFLIAIGFAAVVLAGGFASSAKGAIMDVQSGIGSDDSAGMGGDSGAAPKDDQKLPIVVDFPDDGSPGGCSAPGVAPTSSPVTATPLATCEPMSAQEQSIALCTAESLSISSPCLEGLLDPPKART